MWADYQTIHSAMPVPKLNYVTCADSASGHRMAYWQCGPKARLVLAEKISRFGAV